jgi:hypothetical protein
MGAQRSLAAALGVVVSLALCAPASALSLQFNVVAQAAAQASDPPEQVPDVGLLPNCTDEQLATREKSTQCFMCVGACSQALTEGIGRSGRAAY